jgi:hypothetical protein
MVGQSMPHKGALMAYWEAAGSLLQPKHAPAHKSGHSGADSHATPPEPSRSPT